MQPKTAHRRLLRLLNKKRAPEFQEPDVFLIVGSRLTAAKFRIGFHPQFSHIQTVDFIFFLDPDAHG